MEICYIDDISSSPLIGSKAIGGNLSTLFNFSPFFFGAGNKSSYNATTNKLLSVNFISFVTILILCHEYHALALTPFRLHHPQQPSLIQKVHHAVTRSIWFRLCAPKKVSGIYLLQSKIFIVVKVDK